MLFLKAIPTSGARLYDLRQAQTELTLSAKFQKLLPEKLQIYIFFFFLFTLQRATTVSRSRTGSGVHLHLGSDSGCDRSLGHLKN